MELEQLTHVDCIMASVWISVRTFESDIKHQKMAETLWI